MAKSTPAKLAYTAEHQKSREEVLKREARNRARYQAEKKGLVHKGDGKEIGHRVALDNGGAATTANTEVETAARNRGWRKGQHGYKVPNIK